MESLTWYEANDELREDCVTKNYEGRQYAEVTRVCEQAVGETPY